MWITIAILIISAALFANGRIRSDIVALCALCALLIFQILTPAEALSGFSNSVVIMMVGLFVVGGAIFQTGLAKMISSRILKLAGKSGTRLFLLVMLVTASMCFASPFSTPPNALVMPAGQYTFMDYIKVGLPLQIIMGIVMVFVLPLLFPF